MCLHLVLSSLLALGAKAFVAAPIQRAVLPARTSIQWAGLPARRFILTPTDLDSAVKPQTLTIRAHFGTASPAEIPTFIAQPDKTITLADAGLCIEASGARSGDVVRLNRCTGSPAQLWITSRGSRGRIQLEGTEKCINVDAAEGDLNGALVDLRECKDKPAQSWLLEEHILRPTQSHAEYPAPSMRPKYPAPSMRHVAIALISVAALTALSFSIWWRRWHKAPRVAISQGGNVDHGGVCLANPLPVRNDSSTLAVMALSPSLEPGVAVAPPEASQFVVVVTKGHGDELGINVDHTDRKTLGIMSILDGLISQWNINNISKRVQPGDRIIDINGCRDDSMGMVNAASKSGSLRITVERAKEASSAGGRHSDDQSNAYRGDNQPNVSNRSAKTENVMQTISEGELVLGRVRSVKDYGAFVDIQGSSGSGSGLLHRSQISSVHTESLDEVFRPGDPMKALVIKYEQETGRISLSTKELEQSPGDMKNNPLKVYETAEEMAAQYNERILAEKVKVKVRDSKKKAGPHRTFGAFNDDGAFSDDSGAGLSDSLHGSNLEASHNDNVAFDETVKETELTSSEDLQIDKATEPTRSAEVQIDLQSLTVVQLKEKLRSRGLKVSGKKAELICRLQEAT